MPDRPAHSRRWIVRDEDPQTLHAALARWGVEPAAAPEGRVFVDRKRMSHGDVPIAAGAVVEVHPRAAEGPGEQVAILEQRDGILAVSKPAGMPTIPDQHGAASSVLGVLARKLGLDDPARIHTSSRLDADVSGVLLVATTARGRELLRDAREAGRYQRHYVAIASGPPVPPDGLVDAPIGRGKDRRARQVRGLDAVPCSTRYATIQRAGGYALLAAEPLTGRTHQIRVHMAHLGAPLVGDSLYGKKRTLVLASGAVRDPGRIALHAAWVSVRLEPGAAPWTVTSPVPDALRALWQDLGGADDAWTAALASIAPPRP